MTCGCRPRSGNSAGCPAGSAVCGAAADRDVVADCDCVPVVPPLVAGEVLGDGDGVGDADGLGDGDGDGVGFGGWLADLVGGADGGAEDAVLLRVHGFRRLGPRALPPSAVIFPRTHDADGLGVGNDGDGDEDEAPELELGLPPPWLPADWLLGVFGPDEPVGMITFCRPGMVTKATTTAMNIAPAVASTGRSQLSLPLSRSGTWDLSRTTTDRTVTMADFSATAAATAAAVTATIADLNSGRADLNADLNSVSAASNSGRRDFSAGRTARMSGMLDLMSAARDFSQPRNKPKLSLLGSWAILLRMRSRPSPDGTTPSVAACNARRRRSPYSVSGSVMTPAPAPYVARTCRAPCDS